MLRKLKRFFARILNAAAKRLGKKAPIHYLGGTESLPPPLSKEEEEAAFRLMQTDFEAAREILIVHNLRLVVYIAKKFENTGVWLEDLKTGERKSAAEIAASTLIEVSCSFPSLPPPGRYRLVVATRAGNGAEYKLVTATREVTVK